MFKLAKRFFRRTKPKRRFSGKLTSLLAGALMLTSCPDVDPNIIYRLKPPFEPPACLMDKGIHNLGVLEPFVDIKIEGFTVIFRGVENLGSENETFSAIIKVENDQTGEVQWFEVGAIDNQYRFNHANRTFKDGTTITILANDVSPFHAEVEINICFPEPDQ